MSYFQKALSVLFGFCIVFLLSVNHATATTDYYSDNRVFCSSLAGSSLFGTDGEFIGNLGSVYATDSIASRYSNYGNRYSSDSILNRYGEYGSKYNSLSPWNKYSNEGPIIIKNNSILGRLTINKYADGYLNTFGVLLCFIEADDDRLEPYRDLLEDTTTSSTYSMPVFELDSVVCGKNSFPVGGKCVCNVGYWWEDANDSTNLDCELVVPQCADLTNGYKGSDGNCYCNTGFMWSEASNQCIKQKTPTQHCQDSYGKNVFSDGLMNENGTYNCFCVNGYNWNKQNTQCIVADKPTAKNLAIEEKVFNDQDINGFFNKIKAIFSQYTQVEKEKKYLELIDKLEKFQKRTSNSYKSNIATTLISLTKSELD